MSEPLAALLETQKATAVTLDVAASNRENTSSNLLMPEVEKSMKTSYLLSPMQQGMLFHGLHGHESGVDVEQMVCTLHERLEVAPLIQAWQQMVSRHPHPENEFSLGWLAGAKATGTGKRILALCVSRLARLGGG